VHVLAAADPANPYGAALPWPRRGDDDRRPLQRAAGASVVLVDGVAALYLDRGGRSMQTLPAFDDPDTAGAAIGGLRASFASERRDRRDRELVIVRIDGLPIADSPLRDALLAAGFSPGYRGLVLR
jgi:ATP-dependent helicase Lhr and Lhr-like helicase